MKKTPLRKDIVSRVSYPKESLLRFILKDGVLYFDSEGNLPGRGVYLLKESILDPKLPKCLSKAFKKPLDKNDILKAIKNG